MRFLSIRRPQELGGVFKDIGVDSYGIGIMVPKAHGLLLKLDKVSTIAANIIKQEMLSYGGDAAVARHALTGSKKPTDCILIGTEAQFARLIAKLRCQPLGLAALAGNITRALSNYQQEIYSLRLGPYTLRCDLRTLVMGIVNATPDSFSGDGLLRSKQLLETAGDYIRRLAADGADVIDIGGESTRPGSRPVAAKEELARCIPLIKTAARTVKIPVSIDTSKPVVAEQALSNGAVIVNDITSLRNPRMAKVIARHKAGVVLMHMQGTPATMQRKPGYRDLIGEIITALGEAVRRAEDAGIAAQKIIVDPGIGFGKTLQHNLALLNRIDELKVLGKPIIVGPSRKSFIGTLNGTGPQERVAGTIASCVTAARNGAHIVRVHDVKAVRQALSVSDAITRAKA